MNILYTVFSQGRGGAEKYPLTLGEQLRRRGHAAWLLTAEGFPVAREAVERESIDLLTVPSFRKYSLPLARRLRRIVEEKHIDVVHQIAPRDIFLWNAALAGRKETGLYISYQIGVPNHRNALLALFYRRVDGVVAIASHQLDVIARRIPVPRSRVHLLHNAVDLEKFADGDRSSFRKRYGIGDRTLVVSAVGNTVKEKGFYDFLEAAKTLARVSDGSVFVWAGSFRGPEAARAEEAARRSGLGSRLIMTGYIDDVYSLLAASDVFSLPSWSEAFGIVYIEAMAAGLPVAAYAAGGVPDIVTHGEDGLLAPPKDVQGLTGNLRALLDDDALRRRLGSRARTSVEKFRMDRHVDRLLSIYAAGRSGPETRD